MTPTNAVRNRYADATGGFFSGVPRVLKVVAIIAVACWAAVPLVGCSDLRQQADQHDAIADHGDKAVEVVRGAGLTAEEALAWVRADANSAVIALFPAEWQAKIWAAVEQGEDVRPVLERGADALAAFNAEQRRIADDLRIKADENNGKALDLIDSALAIVLTVLAGGGVVSAVTGAIVGKRSREKGRAEGEVTGIVKVAEGINWARVQNPEFDAMFKDDSSAGVGKTLKAAFNTDPVVRQTLKAVKS